MQIIGDIENDLYESEINNIISFRDQCLNDLSEILQHIPKKYLYEERIHPNMSFTNYDALRPVSARLKSAITYHQVELGIPPIYRLLMSDFKPEVLSKLKKTRGCSNTVYSELFKICQDLEIDGFHP